MHRLYISSLFIPQQLAVFLHIEDNEEMIEVTEPQVWTIIGVMVATLVAIPTIVTQSFTRSITALGDRMDARFETMDTKFDGLRTEMVLRFERVDDRFEQVDRRFEQVDKRLERLENRVDDLDSDMQSVVKRVFPQE
jgi:hypothetical protein